MKALPVPEHERDQENRDRDPSPPSPRSARRSGAIMVVVAGGLITLLAFGAIALDVGYMHLTRARAEAAARAAARAGYEHLKKVDFALESNRAAIEARMREYLEQNGISATEATAADIDMERCGEIDISVRRRSPIYLGVFGGLESGDVNVQGSVDLNCNKVAPFAVPTTYQDPDQNGYSNWAAADESIELSPAPWQWETDAPYIIKYGRDSGQPGNNANWVFIPMDDQAQTVNLPSGAYTLPAQDVAGVFLHQAYNVSLSASQRDAIPQSAFASPIGILRAYGVAYDTVGIPDASVFWVLGYDGGSFLIRENDLLAAGYTMSNETPAGSQSFQVTIREGGASTGVIALRLRTTQGSPDFRPADLEFLTKLDGLANVGTDVKMLKVPKQPKILTLTEFNDPVTTTLINSGIPFVATNYLGHTSSFHEFAIDESQTPAQILERLRDRDGSDGGPFDWLHLHHENFAENNFSHQNLNEAIKKFVAEEHRFLFAACWASETLDVGLAKLGSPDWTGDDGVPEMHLQDHGYGPGDTSHKIQYGETFAFQDFYITEDHDGKIPRGSFGEGCPGSCFRNNSEIDVENGGDVVYLDYLNPLLQNHGGFGGREFDESTDTVRTAYVSGDDINLQAGATQSFRLKASPQLHCQEASPPPQPASYHQRRTYHLRESNTYRDPSNNDRQWVDERRLNCDINGDGVRNFIRISEAVNYNCPCGPNESGDPHGTPNGTDRYFLGDINCSGYAFARINHALLDENDNDTWECENPTDHEILKPYVMAQDGETRPEDISGNSGTKVMILSRNNTSNYTQTSNISYIGYMSGTADDDNDPNNGFGRWSYLGGHWPEYLNGGPNRITVVDNHHSSRNTTERFGLAGMRVYLNNILFGSTAGVQPGGNFTPGTGAINPAGLGLGGTGGSFGAPGFTGNSFRTMFRVGSQGIGLPIGAKFQSAPGNFSAGVAAGEDFAFRNEAGTSTSNTWLEFLAWRSTRPADQWGDHPQVFTIPVVERIPTAPAPGLANPTPPEELDDFLENSSNPPAGANTARILSMYAGNVTLPEDDPQQARDLHVVGFMEFFLIDEANQDPNTQDVSVPNSFVTTAWKDGEIRGYFLQYIEAPPCETLYPPSPDQDPRSGNTVAPCQ